MDDWLVCVSLKMKWQGEGTKHFSLTVCLLKGQSFETATSRLFLFPGDMHELKIIHSDSDRRILLSKDCVNMNSGEFIGITSPAKVKLSAAQKFSGNRLNFYLRCENVFIFIPRLAGPRNKHSQALWHRKLCRAFLDRHSF